MTSSVQWLSILLEIDDSKLFMNDDNQLLVLENGLAFQSKLNSFSFSVDARSLGTNFKLPILIEITIAMTSKAGLA